eukprot:TRINITY_DN16785_c0_g1_i1.p1 TRINITY_DN16785_c0_g1~~TRINITY_DN16785_c0_g1_i1.p1  ORF type:complete len:781 (+),score=72.73 TRINITY_DN16785_c0_g1_i1:43-2385(+)
MTTVEEDDRPQPTRKDFETLIYKQLNSQHTQIRDAFKEMVALITDSASAREALSALKIPLKKDSPLTQLKTLSVLGACVKNCGHEFHVELATKKWMDRLLKIVRTTRDDRVRDKILQLLVDWAHTFQLQPLLQEFNIAIHRLKAKGIELPPPTERRDRRPKRPRPHGDSKEGSGRDGHGHGHGHGHGPGTHSRRDRGTHQQQPQNLTAIEILITNIQADMSNLELGLQRPEMLQPGIADECRRHLAKIQVILSTDLPDQATYEFINMSDQLHELLGLYDALFTDSAPEEVKLEKEAVEMKKIEQEIEKEKELTRAKEAELDKLKEQLESVSQELGAARAEAARLAATRPQTEKEKQLKLRLGDTVSKAAGVKDMAGDVRRIMNEQLEIVKAGNQEFTQKLPEYLLAYPDMVEKARLGETKAFQTLRKLYTVEVSTRKKLYNKLQELRGNIRVYCRVRPMSKTELANGHEQCVSFPLEGEIVCKEGGKLRTFEFDIVFQPDSQQEEVFEDTKPLINCVVDGYKVCIFAYGQTGSGKTFTMQGPDGNPGINRRALLRLFELIEERTDTEKSEVSVSLLEIYNETIKDLLNDNRDKSIKYEIKTHPQDGQYVTNLTSFAVTRVEQIDQYMERAQKNRSVGCTNMNEHSSRSHMLLYIVVKTTNLQSNVTTIGKLSLVDLAGSERLGKSGATGERAKEAKCINSSLSALGDVISSLSSNQSHIPYRNSKLTHLLQDSLGGNSKCLMFVNVSPASYNASESNNSMQFASRARGVVLGPAKRNVEK